MALAALMGGGALDDAYVAAIGVDQIIGSVGEEGMALVRAGPLRRRIGAGNELGRDGRGRAERRVVERGEIFARGANRVFLKLLWSPVLAWNRALLVGLGGAELFCD